MNAAFAANSRCFCAAERGAQVAKKPAIDPAEANLDCSSHAVSCAEILRPHRRCQAVLRGIRQFHSLLLGVERRDVAARSEYFLANHARSFWQTSPDRGLNEVSFC